MQDERRSQANAHPPGTVAYLVVREGSNWRDIFRLLPGQVMTVGRSPNNRIALRDEVCSRNHCEVFFDGGKWWLRDLGSRNGTQVDGHDVSGDWPLVEGQVVRIGSTFLGFTCDLSRPFPELPDEVLPDPDTETAIDLPSGAEVHGTDSEPAIIHRTRSTRLVASVPPDAVGSRDRLSRELARLYRLALEMGATRDVVRLSEIVLDGLFAGTSADIGAILLRPREDRDGPLEPGRLAVAAYKAKGERPYQRVSDHLSRVVLDSSEAILARDVSDDSRLASRDSLGEIHARSVICAPIRFEDRIEGVIHLYSTNPDNPLDPDDLEFTLAVADQTGVALENLQVKESLASGLERVRTENETLRRRLDLENQLVGGHASMHRLRESIGRIAPTDATVLIRGESGVGKELVARAIHLQSGRREGPLMCLNCAALSESLLESELFGHEKGSFTGAIARKLGKFEQAHQGTLFLDEVGEMSLAIQAKFLRVLEGHPFERVGGGQSVKVDVRVVAATNRDLEKAVAAGMFRGDLYYRLQVVEIRVDSLRERRSDIPLLANHFLDRFVRKTGRPVRGFTRTALDALLAYDWPGNVRQLQNAIERAVILSNSELLDVADLRLAQVAPAERPPGTEPATAAAGPRLVSLDRIEQEHILATLESTGWNKSRAAQILGIERSTLDRKLKRYEIERP